MKHSNDYSNKQQLIYFLVGLLIMFLVTMAVIKFRPQNRALEPIPLAVAGLLQREPGRDSMLVEIYKIVKYLQVQTSHYPSAPLSIEDMSKVSSTYNIRTDPVTGGREFHTGIDYRAPRGTIVLAAATGIVTEAKWDGGYGNTIRIKHGNGYETTYAHLMNMTVITGEKVLKGDTIGNVGATGKTTGSHLHYEIAYNNRKINPAVFTQTIVR